MPGESEKEFRGRSYEARLSFRSRATWETEDKSFVSEVTIGVQTQDVFTPGVVVIKWYKNII